MAAGGALGASLRFVFGLFFKNYIFLNHIFLSTLFVNILGSFLIGYVISVTQNKIFSEDIDIQTDTLILNKETSAPFL